MGPRRLELVRDEAGARQWQAIDDVVRSTDQEFLPADPPEEVIALLAGELGGERYELWLLRCAGVPVAVGALDLPLLDNTASVELTVQVHPDHRRRGHGRVLADHLLERARAAGRHNLLAEVVEPLAGADVDPTGAPGVAFARGLGARRALVEVRQLLDLRHLDRGRLAALAAAAGPHASGYRLVPWVDRAPDDLVAGVAALRGRMSIDAPQGDLAWEPEPWTADRYRAVEAAAAARGRRRFATAAVTGDGDVVALTELAVSRSAPAIAWQNATIVLAAHRGHRLGLLVKCANLDALRRGSADTVAINTWNSPDNAPMVAINEAIGFRPLDRLVEWRLDLSAVSPGRTARS